MGKTKTLEGPRNLPTGGLVQNELAIDSVPPATAEPQPEAAPAVEMPVVVVDVSVPLSSWTPGGYVPRRVDTKLSQGQSITLRRLMFACQERSARLENGKEITSAGDALRWLLEQIGSVPTEEANDSQG